MIEKEHQLEFYTSELDALEEEIEILFNTQARALLDSGELFLGIYSGADPKRGNIFIRFINSPSKKTPRLDFPYTCFVLPEDSKYPKLWGAKTYRSFLQNLNANVDISDIRIVNYINDESPDYIKSVCTDIGYEFAKSLSLAQVVAIGPAEPPFQYLANLYQLTEEISPTLKAPWEVILNEALQHSSKQERLPQIMTDGVDLPQMLIDKLDVYPVVVLQGPPGTGKTHTIADIIIRLLSRNKSILVASQSNQSVIEVCNKPFLGRLMEEGKVMKTSLLSSEKSRFPGLKSIKDIYPETGKVILTTYYQMSKTWISLEESIFDYVILEEASQAFLTTICAARKIGRKVLVVGDPYQLLPIIKTGDPTKISPDIYQLVNGLESFCKHPHIPYYRVVGSYRLNQRSVSFTNEFYQNTLFSKAAEQQESDEIQGFQHLLHPNGGPVMLKADLSKTGKNVPQIVNFLVAFIDAIKMFNIKSEIAVLTPFKSTLSFLQRELKGKTKNKDYQIETVDRVQGMDVDYCFYVIPDDNLVHALNRNRFNVATSRAKKSTIIITDKKITQRMSGHADILRYLTRLEEEFSFEI